MSVGYYKNRLYTTDISSALKKKKKSKYMVSHPKTGSDSPIESDRESGCDKLVSEPRFRRFWKSLCLGDSRESIR